MRYPLIIASFLVNSSEAATCKVRILNPYASEEGLKQTDIGVAEIIERIVSVSADK